MTSLQHSIQIAQNLKTSLSQIIKGRNDTIDLVLTALFADGHILIEDYPGSGKTTLAKALGNLISSKTDNDFIKSFKRIQFTPDLLPNDVLGVNIFEPSTSSFKFIPGPVFAHIVLADEINRTGPKVQAAFLECMAEKQITIDNQTYKLDDLFFVIGTQNPLDLAGTYPLPLVQLDRFLLKINMTYVDAATELEILSSHNNILTNSQNIEPVTTREEILEARNVVNKIEIHSSIRQAIVDLVQSSRVSDDCPIGLSTRAALMMQKALQAFAIINGRDYVTEDDFKFLAPYVFLHRLDLDSHHEESRNIFNNLLNPIIDKLVKTGLNA